MNGQITSGYCWNNVGPGKIPCIINPPNNTAAVGLPGIESVNNGTKEGPTIALLADSAAITAAVKSAEARLADSGRVLLRASGTEPLVRVMVEAASDSLAQEVARELADVVKSELG